MTHTDDRDKDAEANAHLNAAASDLFAACTEAMIYFLMLRDESADDTVRARQRQEAEQRIFSALRKARGRAGD